MGVTDGVLWVTCAVEGCRGVRLAAEGHCLLHCSDETLRELLPLSSTPVDLDARGVAFDQRSLSRVLDAIPLRIDQRRWLGSARFDGASFQHELTFDDTTFTGPASFTGTAFAADARFGGADFAGDVSFEAATFSEQAWFVGARFRRPASFSGATFAGPAWFQRTMFETGVRFDRATFQRNITFNGASFSSAASFSDTGFQGLAVFDRAVFGAASSWDGARFSVEGQGPPPAAVPTQGATAASAVDPRFLGSVAKAPPAGRPARSRRWRPDLSRLGNVLLPLLAIAVVAAGAFIILRPGPGPEDADQVAPTTTMDPLSPATSIGSPTPELTTAAPSPRGDPSAYKHAFLDENGLPARFNPCEPVRYVVNPAGAPVNWKQVLDGVVAELGPLTGLTFEYDGERDEVARLTDEPVPGAPPIPAGEYKKNVLRESFQPDRYPGVWAPVLIQWSDMPPVPGASPGSDSSGIGRSDQRKTTDGSAIYVSGVIVISRDLDQAMLKGVLMHEFGHVLGLGHTDDPEQVMAADHGTLPTAWGAGDVTGLSKIGRQSGCLSVPFPSASRRPAVTQG